MSFFESAMKSQKVDSSSTSSPKANRNEGSSTTSKAKKRHDISQVSEIVMLIGCLLTLSLGSLSSSGLQVKL